MKRSYIDYRQLAGLYLEDSYVLAVLEHPAEIIFRLEVVLTPRHPAYHTPLSGEQYCYANGALTFKRITKTEWVSRSFRGFTDAAGDEDFGNIDSLTNENGIFSVEGDWGQVRIWSNCEPRFSITPERP